MVGATRLRGATGVNGRQQGGVQGECLGGQPTNEGRQREGEESAGQLDGHVRGQGGQQRERAGHQTE